METMDRMNIELARLLAAKATRRRALAALPFSDKVTAVVKLRKWRRQSCAPVAKRRVHGILPQPQRPPSYCD
jgi:hypothetical protein